MSTCLEHIATRLKLSRAALAIFLANLSAWPCQEAATQWRPRLVCRSLDPLDIIPAPGVPIRLPETRRKTFRFTWPSGAAPDFEGTTVIVKSYSST